MRLRRLSIVWVFSAVLLAACAPPGLAPSSDGSSGVPQPADKKRIVAGLRGDPPILGSKLYSTVGSSGGPTEIERLMNAGLTIRDDRTELRPILAEAVPTTENGAWQVFPDGRMVTTWKIRTGAAWHDGTPFTSADLVFTAKVVMDGELTELKDSAFNGIDSVQAPDPRTVVVNWKRPFIYANTIFLLPQPKHLLEETYLQSKDAYRSMSYWTDDYVGAGPFKLREFARGDHVTLVANDAFVLGRPRVDEVEIRFVPNTNSLAAHILAGSIDMTLEQDTMSADTVAQMLTSGWPGRAVQHMDDPIGAWPQFMDPSPRVILEAPFRRALVHALDRQLMADNLEYGLSQVAHTPLWPDDPMFRYAEPRVVKYAYDQRQAIELIQGLGYARDSDAMFRDASGQPLKVELRATPGHELSTKSTLVAADMWQAVGVAVDTVMIPPALNNDGGAISFTGYSFVPANPDWFRGGRDEVRPEPVHHLAGPDRREPIHRQQPIKVYEPGDGRPGRPVLRNNPGSRTRRDRRAGISPHLRPGSHDQLLL